MSIHPASLLLPLSLLLSLLLTTPAAAKASTPTTTMAATRARAAFHLLPSTGATHRHRHSTLRMLLHPAQTPNIRLVASDVDGTLLTTAHTIAPRTVQAIRRMVQEKGVLFVPATGKSRGGVRNALGALGRELTGPPGPSREGKGGLWGVGGVYLQVRFGVGVWFGERVEYRCLCLLLAG